MATDKAEIGTLDNIKSTESIIPVCQVPTTRVAVKRRSAAITLSAVILPVAGVSLGTFCMLMVKLDASASTLIVCMFRLIAGSAHTSTVVRSGPIPASASAAATFTLAGKALAASLALPLNTCFACSRLSTLI